MTVHNKFKPYIRRMRLSDYSMNGDIIVDIDLAYFEVRKKPAYVLLVHGIRSAAIMCKASKQEIKQAVEDRCGNKITFNKWCNMSRKHNIKHRAEIREAARNEFGKVRDD